SNSHMRVDRPAGELTPTAKRRENLSSGLPMINLTSSRVMPTVITSKSRGGPVCLLVATSQTAVPPPSSTTNDQNGTIYQNCFLHIHHPQQSLHRVVPTLSPAPGLPASNRAHGQPIHGSGPGCRRWCSRRPPAHRPGSAYPRTSVDRRWRLPVKARWTI